MPEGGVICIQAKDGLVRIYTRLIAKPSLPEAARRFMVKAEHILMRRTLRSRSKNGKLIDVAPWFPPAYFNRAFLEGEEQRNYRAAVADMQTYLKLAPDAKDAREAQDQIYAWQVKAK